MRDLVIRSTRVVTPGGIGAHAVLVRGGRITGIADLTTTIAGAESVDVGEAVVMPGLVDTHVHVNEPGRTEWEGFATATHAAAAGGVTTLLDMPLNSIPATTSAAALETKRAAARGQCWVDVGFLGGVVPGNATELDGLFDAGVLGFKSFLVPSGVPEFAHVDEHDLRVALPVLARLGAALMVHAELPGPLAAAPRATSRRSYAEYAASRPRGAEEEAIALVLSLAEECGTRVHIVHVSSGDSLALLAAARSRGVSVTAETCPHYLYFAAGEIPEGGTEFKCAPPIRESSDRDELWNALDAGVLDCIVSDHSPCPPEMKCRDTGDFGAAWGGIASLQLGLSIVWNGMRARSMAVERLATWMSAAPARLAGLARRKGSIAVGRDADIVVWRPEEEYTVTAESLLHRHKLTPYLGARLPGVVEATYLRGERIYERGAVGALARGLLLARDPSER
ncbi:MAG: allantoinase AllB [Gemmatimonadales bacterium]